MDVIYLFKSKRLQSGVQSRTVCAASVKTSPSIEDSNLNDDDGQNLAAARFIAWSIDESSPADRIDDNDPQLNEKYLPQITAGGLASMY
jgi:hypothetical protein